MDKLCHLQGMGRFKVYITAIRILILIIIILINVIITTIVAILIMVIADVVIILIYPDRASCYCHHCSFHCDFPLDTCESRLKAAWQQCAQTSSVKRCM